MDFGDNEVAEFVLSTSRISLFLQKFSKRHLHPLGSLSVFQAEELFCVTLPVTLHY